MGPASSCRYWRPKTIGHREDLHTREGRSCCMDRRQLRQVTCVVLILIHSGQSDTGHALVPLFQFYCFSQLSCNTFSVNNLQFPLYLLLFSVPRPLFHPPPHHYLNLPRFLFDNFNQIIIYLFVKLVLLQKTKKLSAN